MLKRRRRKASFVGIFKLQKLVSHCFTGGIPESLQSRRGNVLPAYTPAYNFWPCGGRILSCAVSLFAMAMAHLVVTSSAQLTPQHSLNLGILVAESCDATLNAKIDALVSKAFQDVHERIQQENSSASSPLAFSSVTNSYCKLQHFVKNMDLIFGNASIHAVLVLASRDLHASLVTMADIYDKAYLPLNSFLLLPPESQALSLSPSYEQRSLIMSTILDKYQWQSVYVVYTNVQAFEDFAFVFYIKMTLLKFNVTLYAPMGSPISTEDAVDSLKDLGEFKVVLMLMDVTDQLTFLAAASTLSKTKDHAYFTFTKTPYDVAATSLVGQKADVTSAARFTNDSSAANVNILNSVFVIASTFPEDTSRNGTSAARVKRQSGARDKSDTENRAQEKRSAVLKFSSERELISENSEKKRSLSAPAKMCLNNRCVYKTSVLEFNSASSSIMSPPNRPSDSSSVSSFQLPPTTVFSSRTNSALSYFALARNTASAQEKENVNRDFPPSESLDRRKKLIFPLQSAGPYINDIEELTPPREKDVKKNDVVFASEKRVPGNSRRKPLPLLLESTFTLRNKREIESFQPSDVDIRAVYDVSYAVAYSVFKYLESSPSPRVPTGQQLIQSIRNITFSGNSGEYVIGDDQRVQYDFTLYDYNDKSGMMEPRTHYQATSPSEWMQLSLVETEWQDDLLPGPDPCFKQLPNCNDGLKASYIAGIVISALVLVIIGVVAALIFRRYWLNKEMTKGPNKVILNTEDLVFVLRKEMGKGSRILKSRATLLEKDNAPDLIRGSDPNRSMASINELSDYTETARYNGDLVHVKELDIKGFEMRSKLLTYIRMCRDLRHENLNPYVGFLADPLRPSIVMEYCSRGSLNDIIHNDDFKLDWDFKLSLLTDLVRGVRYLHSSALRYHGHITSKNCVIDSRFVLKITDYGIPGIMERCKALMEFETRDLLWSAPELLRNPILLQKGSDKGDLYAMAIIFQEVTLRSEPYSTTGLTPEEIIKKLKKPPPLIRPSVTPQAAPPQFIQIMKQCWSEMPEMRPNIDEVYDQFKKLTGGKKANIVDTMFKMLEKYSTDLEDIVADRTMQLEEEKKKTDQLLFRMLPPTVAESLKIGRNVEAECFDEVTIYFSDIVGFTTISAMSTPMQVVDLLNDLYTMFDATINDHDVYKVETIGDAYMVVSGLPIRNGNRHAGEIGTLALVLLSQCGKFTIRHMPQVPLRLRIGLHTGSCVAGVVGLTMPRFCLFGDTVNTASRMESTGAAFRIHISEPCKFALDVLGGYVTEYRGQTELKGKGLHNTYWLVGKEGFDKDLPEPPPLVGDTTHGLDSILGDIKLENMLHVTHQDTLAKSNSAPNIINNSGISNKDSPSHPSGSGGAANHLSSTPVGRSQPSKHNATSVVKVDINLTGHVPALEHDTASDTLGVCSSEVEESLTSASALKSKHSESNDSGFGSERKHSHGNDSLAPGVGYNGGSEKPKRTKSSLVSSSDVTLNTNYALLMDLTDELTPVTEV